MRTIVSDARAGGCGRSQDSPRLTAGAGVQMTVSERWRTERLLAVGRAVLAVVSVLIVTGQLEPSFTEHRRLVVVAVEVYGAISLGVLLALLWVRRIPSAAVTIVHVLDLLWAAFITTSTQGPSSPFFVFLSFVLVEAAFRWGLTATLWTAAIAMGLLVFELRDWRSLSSASAVGGTTSLLRGQLAMRATFLLLMGFLLGYLAELEKRFRRRTRLVANVLAGVQRQPGLRGVVRTVLGSFLDFYHADQGVVVVAPSEKRAVVTWQARRLPSGQVTLSLCKPAAWGEWVASVPPARLWHAQRRRGSLDVLALNDTGRLQHLQMPVEPLRERLHVEFRSLVGIQFHVQRGEPRQAWLVLFDPQWTSPRSAELRFLAELGAELDPAMRYALLLRRLQVRTAAMERGRIARELHDGAVQSLLAAEMEVGVLERQTRDPVAARVLERVRQLLHQQALALRNLMELLRPLYVSSTELPRVLAEEVEKFRRETGIAARFACPDGGPTCSPVVSRELVRIVQEGLFNVRRHSGATAVVVSLEQRNGRWELRIEDNGRGFDFTGTRQLDELEAEGRGPRIICERVREIGGRLWIASEPGCGARIVIALPEEA